MASQMLGRSTQRGQETDKEVPEGLTELLIGVGIRADRSRSILVRGREWLWKKSICLSPE